MDLVRDRDRGVLGGVCADAARGAERDRRHQGAAACFLVRRRGLRRGRGRHTADRHVDRGRAVRVQAARVDVRAHRRRAGSGGGAGDHFRAEDGREADLRGAAGVRDSTDCECDHYDAVAQAEDGAVADVFRRSGFGGGRGGVGFAVQADIRGDNNRDWAVAVEGDQHDHVCAYPK